jgi:hypothetical protein
MDEAHIKARFDWLVELGGAAAPGLAAGYAALKLAPTLALAPAAAMAAAGSAGFGLGLLAMRVVRPSPRAHALPGFAVAPVEAVAGEPLLLDVRLGQTVVVDEVAGALAEDDALLLDDPLLPIAESRVVQLFASPAIPTPGQLKQRIDRHMAVGERPPPGDDVLLSPDASEALYAALAELRRSLR